VRVIEVDPRVRDLLVLYLQQSGKRERCHELHTPLNAIIGFSEVLSEGMFCEINEKQTEYLQDILESIPRRVNSGEIVAIIGPNGAASQRCSRRSASCSSTRRGSFSFRQRYRVPRDIHTRAGAIL
jgi:signal transduction histidine kinase